jgi:hypothetical protein
LENEVKDDKLGTPLGLMVTCPFAPSQCPDMIESRFALDSTDHLRQNLVGFRRLFQGCGPGFSGVGFDDWLEAVGQGDLAQEILTALTDTELAVDRLDPPLEAAIFVDVPEVRALHATLKRLTDLLKTQFHTVLDLDLPMSVEGDND